MQLQWNGSMYVKEHITVDFITPKRGIIREIPYINRKNWRINRIKNIEVVGGPLHKKKIENQSYFVQIGNPNKTLLWEHTYTITYLVKNAIVPFVDGKKSFLFRSSGKDAREELYRNVIGNDWDTYIENVSFTITLPQEHIFESGDFFSVYGKFWERRQSGLNFEQENSKLFVGAFNERLNPGEGITIGLKFSKNYFSFPIGYALYFFNTQVFLKVILFIFFAIFLFILLFFWKTWIIPIIFLIIFMMGIFDFWRKYLIAIFLVFRSTIVIYWFVMGKLARIVNRKVDLKKMPYYTPPKNIPYPLLFSFRYWNTVSVEKVVPQVMMAVFYYLLERWVILVEDITEKKTWYKFLIKKIAKSNLVLSELEIEILEILFKYSEEIIFSREYSNAIYHKLRKLNALLIRKWKSLGLDESLKIDKKSYLFESDLPYWYKGFLLINGRASILTAKWKEIVQELDGYRLFLKKVEIPVIEDFLKKDPNFIDKALPWLSLWGLETHFLKKLDVLIKNWWYLGKELPLRNPSFMNNISNCIIANSRSASLGSSWSSGGSSGFSSSRWSSGGWGGWGWGRSW